MSFLETKLYPSARLSTVTSLLMMTENQVIAQCWFSFFFFFFYHSIIFFWTLWLSRPANLSILALLSIPLHIQHMYNANSTLTLTHDSLYCVSIVSFSNWDAMIQHSILKETFTFLTSLDKIECSAQMWATVTYYFKIQMMTVKTHNLDL